MRREVLPLLSGLSVPRTKARIDLRAWFATAPRAVQVACDSETDWFFLLDLLDTPLPANLGRRYYDLRPLVDTTVYDQTVAAYHQGGRARPHHALQLSAVSLNVVAMHIEDIRTLVERLDATPIGEFEYRRGSEGLRVVFSRSPAIAHASYGAAGTVAVEADIARQTSVVRAQAVGFYTWCHPLSDVPPVVEGDLVAKGQHVGYISVASVVRVVYAPFRGNVRGHIAKDGCIVGYGDPLVEIEDAGDDFAATIGVPSGTLL